ncbi:MAG: VCBS repeat-containing protein [Planctomycetes bacterium]|nr:VCBS repeat-containing protein [Planctomycetota bacterium]
MFAALQAAGAGGGGQAAPVVSFVDVMGDTRTSPAHLVFDLTNQRSIPVDVRILYYPSGPPTCDPTVPFDPGSAVDVRLTGDSNLHFQGGGHFTRDWDFAGQIGTAYHAAVRVEIRASGALQDSCKVISVGNDAPTAAGARVVNIDSMTGEVVGIVHAQLTVADSSSDLVDIDVEFRRLDEPGTPWHAASPEGAALRGISTATIDPNHPVDFFWSVHSDLGASEHEVQLQFTPYDLLSPGHRLLQGAAACTPCFRVDNNQAPTLLVEGDAFVDDADARRGVPIPFTVIDPENDPVTVVFQWTRAGEPFPVLPPDPLTLSRVLANPVDRRRYRIATEAPTSVCGLAVPVDETKLMLPEIASTEAGIRGPGGPGPNLMGRRIELLRSSSVPTPASSSWAKQEAGTHSLDHPVAAIPVGVGVRALVLDRSESNAWRLRIIDLATGHARDLVPCSSSGAAQAMTVEKGGRAVLVAESTIDGGWRVERVVARNGAVSVTPIVESNADVERGDVRGIASLSPRAAVVTVGSSLVRFDYDSGTATPKSVIAPNSNTGATGLHTPWGVVTDSQHSNRVFVAEHDGPALGSRGRIVAVDLETHSVDPVGPLPPGVPNAAMLLPHPEAMTLEPPGDRLLVVTDENTDDGTLEIRTLDLGRARQATGDVIVRGIQGSIGALGSGPDGLRIVALTDSNDLAIGGGVEQSRIVGRYDPSTRTATVQTPFEPIRTSPTRWRISDGAERILAHAGPAGTRDTFVWNSSDAAGGGPVLLRGIAFESDIGIGSGTGVPRPVHAAVDVAPGVVRRVDDNSVLNSIAVADLDGDGDLDLVVGDDSQGDLRFSKLSVYLQSKPGCFSISPQGPFGGPILTDVPRTVAAADLDGDGFVDIVSANFRGRNITVFHQDPNAPGTFGLVQEIRGPVGHTIRQPRSLAIADFDGDGRLDLAVGDVSEVSLFVQDAPGHFDDQTPPTPLVPSDGLPFSLTVVVASDVNSDGRPDIVAASDTSRFDSIVVFENMGNREFTDTRRLTAEIDNPTALAAADLNGDGRQDIVCTSADANTIALFFQAQDGTFGVPSVRPVGAFPRSVTVADLDGDGDLDVAAACLTGMSLAILYQESPGVFSAQPLLVTGMTQPMTQPRNVAAADLDGDGFVDLVATDPDRGGLSLYLQRRPGAFDAPPKILGDDAITDSPNALATGDLDGDGDTDLVASSSVQGGGLAIFTQVTPGKFDTRSVVLHGAAGDLLSGVAMADVDGDGDLDLVGTGGERSSHLLLWTQESGAFQRVPIMVPAGASGDAPGPKGVAIGDVDGDGRLDLVSANFDGNSVTVLYGDASRTFTRTAIVEDAKLESPVSVALADLDGDGRADVMSADSQSGNVGIFYFDSAGTERQRVFLPLPNGAGPLSVATGDLDGDGRLDIACAAGSANELVVFYQRAMGGFDPADPPTIVSSAGEPGNPQSVAIADMNGDGRVDLVSANYNTHDATIYLQSSPGRFSQAPRRVWDSDLDGPQALAVVDVDGDGDPDVVTANFGTNRVKVFYSSH